MVLTPLFLSTGVMGEMNPVQYRTHLRKFIFMSLIK